MNLKNSLAKLEALGFCRYFDDLSRLDGGIDQKLIFKTTNPSQLLRMTRAALYGMSNKRSLDDGTHFHLLNEQQVRILMYNLALQARREKGETKLTNKLVEEFRQRTDNCCLMDYGAYVSELSAKLFGKPKLPKNFYGYR